MCIFAAPVRDVSDTKIAVVALQGGAQQLTVYQNKAVTLGRNAMVLPVPAGSDITLIDLSEYGTAFWTACETCFPPEHTNGTFGWGAAASTTGGFGAAPPPPLPVQQVGQYQCSVAPTLADLGRINRTVFTLSPDAAKTLGEHYASGFSFIVCLFEGTVEGHPIAYVSSTLPGGRLFIPTRHDHGSTGGADDGTLVHHGANCDGCRAQNIHGNRYKCCMCPDFDFCAKCYTTAIVNHDPTHVFAEYKREAKHHGNTAFGSRMPLQHGGKDERPEYDHIVYIFGAQLVSTPDAYTSKREVYHTGGFNRDNIDWMRVHGGRVVAKTPALRQRVVIKGAFRNGDYCAAAVMQ